MGASNTMTRDAMARNTPDGLVLPLPSPLLAMLPPDLQGYPMQWFVQYIQLLTIAPNTAKTGQFTTDNTHVHVSFYGSLKVRSQDNQTDRDADPAAFLMTDTQNLQYQQPGVQIDIVDVWGNAKQPAIWPVPLIVPTNSGINLTVTNQSNANTNNYNFAFMGCLIKVPAGLKF